MSGEVQQVVHAGLWALERRFWTGDAAFHAAHLAAQAWMLLPAPAGMLGRAQSLQAVAQAPRWDEVAFSGTCTLVPAEQVAVLVYAVDATRAGQPPYRAWCSSTYVREPAGWRLLVHQQTPQ